MRDYEGLTEGVHPENPVFDVEAANAALSRVNLYLDSQLHSGGRNDAADAYAMSGVQSGMPGQDLLDEYLDSLIVNLMGHGMSEEQAIDMIGDCVDALIARDMIVPIPSDGDPDEDFSYWVGLAQTANLAMMCVQKANK